MTIKDIKAKMLAHKDFFGGDIMYRDEIESAKTKKELAEIMDKYRTHIDMVCIEFKSHHERFKKELGLNFL